MSAVRTGAARPAHPRRAEGATTGRMTQDTDDRLERDEGDHDERPARLRHHPARRRAAGGAQPLRVGQARHRAAPRRARGRLHRGWLARGEPEGHRVLRPGRDRAAPAQRHARGVRRDPAGRRQRGRRPPGPGAARQPGPGRHPRREVPRRPRRAGAADHPRGEPRDDPRHRLVPARARAGASSSTPSTSSTGMPPTATTRSRRCGRRWRPEPRSSRCATPTAACCPDQVADVVGRRGRRPRPARGRHPLPQRHRLRRGQLDGGGRRRRHARAGHHQRLRRAHRQRRPAHRRRATSSSSAGCRCSRPHRLREATRIAHAISEVTNVPAYWRQPYVGASAFAHKAGLHASAIKVDPDLYQHTDPQHVGNDMRMLVSDMAGRASIELKGRELGLRPVATTTRRCSSASWPRSRTLELRGYTFDAADASFELLLRREVEGDAARLLRGRVVAGHHRRPRRRGRPVRGDGQARRRRRARRARRARATARSTRSTTPCAARSRRPTPSSTTSS